MMIRVCNGGGGIQQQESKTFTVVGLRYLPNLTETDEKSKVDSERANALGTWKRLRLWGSKKRRTKKDKPAAMQKLKVRMNPPIRKMTKSLQVYRKNLD